jgi:hypothetical protein
MPDRRHFSELLLCQVLEFVSGFCLMPLELLVLKVIPDFLVGIPVWRVLGKMEDMKPGLRLYELGCLFGCMGRCLVHDDHQMPLPMVLKHLRKKVHDLLRRDPFVVESEDKTAATCDRRHGRNGATLSGNCLFRRLPTGCPGFPQQRGYR